MTPFSSEQAHRRMRAGGDLYGRSAVGPLFYAIGCLVTASVSHYLMPLRLMGWLPAALFVAMYFLRRANRLPSDFEDPRPYQAWRLRHWALIHLGCLLWGAVSFYFESKERGAWLPFSVAVIISVMLGSALSTSFSMEKRQTSITLCILYGPSVIFFISVPELRPNAIMLVVYVAYQLASLVRFAREYDAQMVTEYALLQSRAEIEQLTRIDALTGLANRREYEIFFPKAWHQATRQKTHLSMLVFDLDHFKLINDGHGHLAGDACLQHFANLLRDHFRREVDLIARIGGEEFVALLPGVSAEAAARMAEEVREQLQRTPCPWEGAAIAMTVSIGVGSANPALDPRPDATFARIDGACYEAKTSGRNRVILSNPTTAKLAL